MFVVYSLPCGEKRSRDEWQAMEIFPIYSIGKGLIFLIYKDLLQINKKKTNIQRESKKRYEQKAIWMAL